ncbi:MAG: molybdopterin-binding oxidoreductase, partial [uncultured Acidimicrobiales bacterium]
ADGSRRARNPRRRAAGRYAGGPSRDPVDARARCPGAGGRAPPAGCVRQQRLLRPGVVAALGWPLPDLHRRRLPAGAVEGRLPPHGDRNGRPSPRAHLRRAHRDDADVDHGRLPVRHRLAGARCAVGGRASRRHPRRRRCEAGCQGVAVHLLRRRLHREPHARPGPPERRDRRLLHGGRRHLQPPRRPGAPLCGAHVWLQVDQVARWHRGHRRRPAGLLGSAGIRRGCLGRGLQPPERCSDRL